VTGSRVWHWAVTALATAAVIGAWLGGAALISH
jgi:hypothetical protein